MSESYFFAISPKFLKAEHSFAKNVKPNTKYRLAVFKGIFPLYWRYSEMWWDGRRIQEQDCEWENIALVQGAHV